MLADISTQQALHSQTHTLLKVCFLQSFSPIVRNVQQCSGRTFTLREKHSNRWLHTRANVREALAPVYSRRFEAISGSITVQTKNY